MQLRNSKLLGAAAVLTIASQLFAGGFYLVLGNPEASPMARKMNAVLTIQATGCHDPASATLSATAIGLVNGERKEIPLKVEKMNATGMFALTRQWPKEGKWVIKLVGKQDTMYTNSLIPVGPDGPDRLHDRANYKEFTAADVDAMLK